MTVWLAVARVVAGATTAPLTDRETAIFRVMYTGVPETAGYPLAVLFERLDVVEPWLAATAAGTGPVTPDWGTLYAVLATYAYMAVERREVDRERKRREAAKKRGNAGGPPAVPGTPGATSSATAPLQSTHVDLPPATPGGGGCRCGASDRSLHTHSPPAARSRRDRDADEVAIHDE